MTSYVGESAALLTSLCWASTSTFFTIASRNIGPAKVNLARLLLASIFLMISHLVMSGQLLPLNIPAYRWGWLGLSGIVGLIIGDGMLLRAFVLIGTRLSMLLMSLVPIISTLLAWIFLNEILGMTEIMAILITVAGILWVISERKNNNGFLTDKKHLLGILLGFGGALGQAFALLTAKRGMSGDFPPLSATLIRMLVATSTLWFFALVRGRYVTIRELTANPKAFWALLGGSIFGPFLGIWLSLTSIKYAPIGIASTLMSLPPIILIPISHWILKERITWRSVIGTIIALIGVAMIFLA